MRMQMYGIKHHPLYHKDSRLTGGLHPKYKAILHPVALAQRHIHALGKVAPSLVQQAERDLAVDRPGSDVLEHLPHLQRPSFNAPAKVNGGRGGCLRVCREVEAPAEGAW